MALKKKLFVGALLPLAGLFLLIFLIWITTPKSQTFISAKGSVTLQGYNFSTNTVEYRHPKSVLDHKFLRAFVKPIRKYLPRLDQIHVSCRPQFAGEPMLTCEFLINFPRPADSFSGRVVVSDENGNEFDPVGQANTIGDIPAFYPGEVPVFPRRGRTLNLQLKQNAEAIAEFQIPNPAYREFPQWVPSSLPISTKSGDLEVKLTDFTSERAKEYGTNFPATRCGFQFRQDDALTTNWIPHTAEILDATGNHWNPSWYRERVHFVDSTLYLQFFGALWPGENAWKLRISFQQHAGFSDKDLIRFDDLPVPRGAEILRPKLVHEEPDARFELLGLFGPNSTPDQARAVFINIYPRFGMVTLAFKAHLAEYDRAFCFVSLSDENGKEIVPFELTDHAIDAQRETYVPYLVYAKVPPDAKKLTLICALPKTRAVEFMAKPAQP